jgi:hypothetical protein
MMNFVVMKVTRIKNDDDVWMIVALIIMEIVMI